MGIPIGACGIELNNTSIIKLKEAREIIDSINPICRLGLDGGVNKKTFPRIIKIVDEIVIGSLLTCKNNLSAQWTKLKSATKNT